jgi:dinuclear metal center YbgI/SA1388 family protein
VNVRDICTAIDELAPPALAYEWDRAGLNIGNPEWPVTGVLVALTVTPEAAKKALRNRHEMIVSHHPVIWEPLHSLRSDVPHTRMCLELAHARVACYSAHTSLDVAPGGVNDTLAALLELRDCRPLFPVPHAGMVKLITFVPEKHLGAVREAVCRAGAGAIGEYTHCTFSAEGIGTFCPSEDARPFSGERQRLNEEPERRFETLAPKARASAVVKALLEAHPYEEVAYDLVPLENKDAGVALGVRGRIETAMTLEAFAEHVRERLGLSHVRVVGRLSRRVRRVAVMGGSGGGKVADLPAETDVFVTGDVGYHDALAAHARGIALIDAGHAGTEKCAVTLLAQHLRKHFPKLRISSYEEPPVFGVVFGGRG